MASNAGNGNVQPPAENEAAAGPAAATTTPVTGRTDPVSTTATNAAATGQANGPRAVLDEGWHPWHSVVGAMGYGRRGTLLRKHLFTLGFKIVLGLGQIVSIAVLCAIAVNTPSVGDPTVSEWNACDRPLGPWMIVWAVRVCFGLAVSLYSFFLVRPGLNPYMFDPENNVNADAVNNNQTPPPVGPLNGPGQPQHVHAGRTRPLPRGLQSLTTILSLLSLIWFIASHVLVYSSLYTCRETSPHLWYLAFSIMAIVYVLIAEMLIVVFFIFFFVPMLLLLINLVLLCIGRQPLFRPGGINHEIGKLPQTIVDRIPLVMYIPTPPPKDTAKADAHTYPPATSPTGVDPSPEGKTDVLPGSKSDKPTKKHRFVFFRRSKKTKGTGLEESKGAKSKSKQKGPEDEWEANWERGDYPFVKLPDNRATCAICLLDFEEPPRRGSVHPAASTSAEGLKSKPASEKKVQVEPHMELQDVGEGATPLRLLACGHCFHQSCLDPWLKDVSGRCPVCQRKVDIEELEKLSKGGFTWTEQVVTPSANAAGPSPPANAAGPSPPDPSTLV